MTIEVAQWGQGEMCPNVEETVMSAGQGAELPVEMETLEMRRSGANGGACS